MLTTEEKNIISLIATDLESGRHLIRQKSEWKKVLKSCGNGLKKEDCQPPTNEFVGLS